MQGRIKVVERKSWGEESREQAMSFSQEGTVETKEIPSQNSWWEHAWQMAVKAVRSREKK